MNDEVHVLDEFNPIIARKSKLIAVLLGTLTCYVLVVSVDLVFDVEHLSWKVKQVEWEFVAPFLLIPFFGLIFFVGRSKVGWTICLLYYMLIASLISGTILKLLCKDGFQAVLPGIWRACYMFLLSAVSTSLLLAPGVRAHFKITATAFRITLAISLVISATLTLLVVINLT